jgi:hypothetical protein
LLRPLGIHRIRVVRKKQLNGCSSRDTHEQKDCDDGGGGDGATTTTLLRFGFFFLPPFLLPASGCSGRRPRVSVEERAESPTCVPASRRARSAVSGPRCAASHFKGEVL